MEKVNFNEIRNRIYSFRNLIVDKKTVERLDKDNRLNGRVSSVISSLYDIETIVIRLNKNIELFEKTEEIIQLRNKKEDKKTIREPGQKLRREAEYLNRENFLDLKSLHIFIKIFLDDFTELIRFIFNWRNIGNRSITNFYTSLNKYSGNDSGVIVFKEKCFSHIEQIINLVVDYRDNSIVHNQQKHKQTIWSINDMRGNISQVSILSQGTECCSLNQGELISILFTYLDLSLSFIEDSFEVSNKI